MPWRPARSRTIATPCSISSGERDGVEVELHLARLDLREVEDLVDQLEQMPPRVADVARRTRPGARSARRTSGRAGRPRSRSPRSAASAARATCWRGTRTCAGSPPRARASSARARGRRGRCGSPRPTGWRASRAGPTVSAGSAPGTCAPDDQRADDLVLAPERDARPSSASRGARSASTCGSGGSSVEIRRLRDLARAPPRWPMNVSSSPIRISRSASTSSVARAGAGAQHELARRRLELEDRTAVRSRELGRAGDDRRQHLVEIEARADRLADLAERAQLVDGLRELPLRCSSSWNSSHVLDRDHALRGERRHKLDRPVVERVDLRAPQRDHADDAVVGQHRDAEHRAEPAELARLVPLILRVRGGVGDLHGAPLEPDAAHERPGTLRDGVLARR